MLYSYFGPLGFTSAEQQRIYMEAAKSRLRERAGKFALSLNDGRCLALNDPIYTLKALNPKPLNP